VVAARLGPADPTVTLRVYAQVIQDLAPAVVDTFARAIQAASGTDSEAGVSTAVSTRPRGGRHG
jgi:hypothetical protein